ncbi:MAG: serine/threonine-protein kinase [Planctomycetaceae bacterium]
MAAKIKLNPEAFLGLLRQSGLVDSTALESAIAEIRAPAGSIDDARVLAEGLVSRSLITRWQADKLLQGKHRGFFLGKYRLLSHLGSGGMSSVYLAEHLLMRRRVAVKVLPKSRLEDTSYLERFHREARAVASLDHRNIVRAYDVDQEDNNHFLVMEYVPGQSLHQLVTNSGPLGAVAAADYIRQAAEGLHQAHRLGMVHRDIKPGNLLLDESGTIKLLDLGLARFFDEDEDSSLTRQHDEQVLGTADYLSPEQALDSHNVDFRSDIYGLGCTMYFLLTGHGPFPDGSLAQRLLAHQTRQPRAVEKERHDVPTSLLTILYTMMAKRPEQRFQSARDVAQALLQWLNENGGSKWAGMNPVVPAASSVGMTAASAAGPAQTPVSAANAGSAAGGFAEPSLAGAMPVSARASAPEPELVAFLSNLATEDSGPLSTSDTRKFAARRRLPDDPIAPITTNTSTPFGEVADRQKTESASPAPLLAADFNRPPGQPISPADAAISGRSRQTAGANRGTPEADRDSGHSSVLHDDVSVLITSSSENREGATRMSSGRHGPARSEGWSRAVLASAAVCGLLLLLGTGGYWLRSAPSSSDPPPAGPRSRRVASDARPAARLQRPAAPSRELRVGPDGQFKTIAAALAEARARSASDRRSTLTIRVASGATYAERVALDSSWPRGIRIVANDGPPPILAPPGPEPIVSLRGAPRELGNFRLEGFHLDAAGKEVAVRLSGWLPGAMLRNLSITGFARAGVHLDGAQTYGAADARITLERLTFREAHPDADGVLLTRNEEDPTHIRVQGCRFLSPLATGLRVACDALDLEIEESIFFMTRTGVLCDGAARVWRELALAFNTFFENERGLVFADMPGAGSHSLGFDNNLFFNTALADAVVEKDFNLREFLLMIRASPRGIGFNWTTRPQKAPVPPGELPCLFESGQGRFGANDVRFRSLDVDSPSFLAPADGSPQRQVGTALDRKRFGTQIGAVR